MVRRKQRSGRERERQTEMERLPGPQHGQTVTPWRETEMDRKRKRKKKAVRSRCREAKLDRGTVAGLYSLNFLLVFLGISVILSSCAKPLVC